MTVLKAASISGWFLVVSVAECFAIDRAPSGIDRGDIKPFLEREYDRERGGGRAPADPRPPDPLPETAAPQRPELGRNQNFDEEAPSTPRSESPSHAEPRSNHGGGGRSPAVIGPPVLVEDEEQFLDGRVSGATEAHPDVVVIQPSGASVARRPARIVVKPDPKNVSPYVALKEGLTPAQLSVRNQVLSIALKIVREERGLSPTQESFDGKQKLVTSYTNNRGDSVWHARGAVDISVRGSKDPHKEAEMIAMAVGDNIRVQVEEVAGPDTRRITKYDADGGRTSSIVPKGNFTGDHIHIHPKLGVFGPEDEYWWDIFDPTRKKKPKP